MTDKKLENQGTLPKSEVIDEVILQIQPEKYMRFPLYPKFKTQLFKMYLSLMY